MKKALIIFAVVIFLALSFLYIKYIAGWKEFSWNSDTSDKYASHTKVKKEDYLKDSVEAIKIIRGFITNHDQSFGGNEYFDGTQLIIDTILYSPDFNKVAVLVIAKNPDSKQLVPDDRYDFYYDGYAYFGTRQKGKPDLTWMGPSYINYHNPKRLSGFLRQYFFREMATIRDRNNLSLYKYNINDIRFWTCPIWKEIDEKKAGRKAFEKEKKEHPENVYEPKQ